MKNTLICPKCSGRRIWVIEKFKLPGESAEGRALAVVPHQDGAKRSALSLAMRATPKGAFDMHMCDGCGYSELWARDFRDLTVDEARGIKLIDNSDLKGGPFR